MCGGKIRIQQYRSGIQAPTKHKLVLRALGLGRLNRVVERPDNAAVRGMVNKVYYMVNCEEV